MKHPPLPADFAERITAARQSQQHYDRHVAPIVVWARMTFGRAAREEIRRLMYDDGTSDTAYQLLRSAYIVL